MKNKNIIAYICIVIIIVNFFISIHLLVNSIQQKDDHALILNKLNEWELVE